MIIASYKTCVRIAYVRNRTKSAAEIIGFYLTLTHYISKFFINRNIY